MLHEFPGHSGFDRKIQAAERAYVMGSQAAMASVAENYVGLPY